MSSEKSTDKIQVKGRVDPTTVKVNEPISPWQIFALRVSYLGVNKNQVLKLIN
jgi:hypothetical protein